MSGLGILWRDTAQEPFNAPALQDECSADLVILGGGFTGCSAALEAAGQGADVVLLEAETIGHGGSGRNVGLVNAGLWLPPDQVCRQIGEKAGEHLNHVLSEAPDQVFGLIERHGIDCEATRAGTLHLAHSGRGLAQLESRHRQMLARGAPVALLTAQEAQARTGTGRFHGALHDARAGTVQPLAYARGLARAAQEAGASVHESSPALSAEYRDGQWVVRTKAGRVRANRLLVATNAYHRPLDRISMPPVPVVHYFQLATEPVSDNLGHDILPGGEGCWDTGLIMTSVRRDRAGRVILGGMGDDVRAHTDWARRKLVQVYPRLSGVGITHAWSGRISMTSDHLPRILRIGPGGYAIFGYSGRGIAPGTVFGRAAATALMRGDETGLPVVPVDGHREVLIGMKSAFFEAGARLVHLLGARG